MKKLFFIATIISCFAVLTAFTTNVRNSIRTENYDESSFCEGWKDGYCEGWKDVKGRLAICPITPICPIAGIGEDTYRGGYNRAFKAGMKAAQN